MSAGKILVIRGGAIGDFVLTIPVLTALRQQFPTARLEVLGYRHIACLAQAGGLIDDVHSIEARALAGFFARNGVLDPALQEYFAGFAIIVSYLFDPDGIFQENVARCSKAQFIVGPHRPNDRAGIHATEVLLKPLERLAIFNADSTPRLKIPPPASTSGLPASRSKRLALHPGSGSDLKNWPEPNWSAAMSRWQARPELSFFLVGGDAEGQRLRRLAVQFPADRFELLENLPLPQLAASLTSCDLFVGHDSGISHLAAALGLPVVALWAESAESVWRPKGPNVLVLKDAQRLSALPVDHVVATVYDLLEGDR